MDRVSLIDLQVNGGFGVDFSSPDLAFGELKDCATSIIDSGTALFLPTVVSCADDTYKRNLPLLVRLCRDAAIGPHVGGIHLEGPFIAPDPRVLGAHRAEHVKPAGIAELDHLLELGGGHVRLMTMAAEIPGASPLAQHAVSQGVRVSLGHSYFDGTLLRDLHASGATALTHLGNALPKLLPKGENPLVAGLLADDYMAMFIADGCHLSSDLMRLLMRCRGPERLMTVSDASPVAGLKPGRYEALGQTVDLAADGAVYNAAEQHLVGSSRWLIESLNTLLALGICTPDDCVRLGSTNPMTFLGLRHDDLPRVGGTVTFDATSRRFVRISGAGGPDR